MLLSLGQTKRLETETDLDLVTKGSLSDRGPRVTDEILVDPKKNFSPQGSYVKDL